MFAFSTGCKCYRFLSCRFLLFYSPLNSWFFFISNHQINNILDSSYFVWLHIDLFSVFFVFSFFILLLLIHGSTAIHVFIVICMVCVIFLDSHSLYTQSADCVSSSRSFYSIMFVFFFFSSLDTPFSLVILS